ncbi:tetratricopeptide repeat protein [Hymenobacter saemangeumensis]|uniref:histidine kinase n=1 Tax=Hymenobacter saemangeumensis TaxID=1084522 RepID=A0ABP8IF47_9BACT
MAGPGSTVPDTMLLQRELAASQPDTARVRRLTALCYVLHDEHPARARTYGEQAVALARRLPARQRAPLLLNSLLHLASCYANLSNGPQALRLIGEAEGLARRLRHADGLARAAAAQGSIFHERGDSITAWQHYRRALQLAEQPDVQPRTRMKLLGNVATLLFFRKQHARALQYDSLALELARSSHDAVAESHYLASLGTYHLQLNQLPEAERLLTRALAISRREGARRVMASQLELLGLYYIATGQTGRTHAVTLEALQLARACGFQERVLDAYSILSAEAAERQEYRLAYEWGQRYQALHDSLNSRQTMQALAATQASYESQERLRHIRELTQQHELELLRSRLLGGLAAVLLAGLLAVGYLYRKLQRSQAALASSHAALEDASQELRGVAVFKDKLYAIVAHDLRGPVTAFAGVTGLIDSYIRQNNQAELARLPAIVRQAADSLNRLLDNVLNWAVSQTGELACRPEALPVADLLAECQQLYLTTAEAGQQRLTVASPPGLCLLADHNMVRTILRNLVGNALKFTPAGGHVHLEAAPDPADPHMVLVSCTDTGTGMSAATVAALMSGPDVPEPVAVPSAAGLGLGLALCRAFVHRHGGTLVIQSRPGAGTNVTVSLPAAG